MYWRDKPAFLFLFSKKKMGSSFLSSFSKRSFRINGKILFLSLFYLYMLSINDLKVIILIFFFCL